MTTKELITQAEHARRCGVSRKSVTVWKERGQLVLSGNLIDFGASYKGDRWHASTKKMFADDSKQEAGSASVKRVAAAPKQLVPAAPVAVTLQRSEVVSRLRALDWTQTFDWSPDAMRARVVAAAEAVSLQAVESATRDDGHWGGYQLRNVELIERHRGVCLDAIAGGYGFDLDEFDALYECRYRLDHPDDCLDDMSDPITIRLDQLPLLAYPFGPQHAPRDRCVGRG